MPRSYTVSYGDRVSKYTGFNRSFNPASEVEFVCLVQVEDWIEVYVLDDTKEARMELVRYLAESECEGTILGVYKRTR